MTKHLLYICKDKSNVDGISEADQDNLDIVALSYADLNDRSVLSYVSSHIYDTVMIQLRDNFNSKALVPLVELGDNFRFEYDNDSREAAKDILIGLYPEKEGSIRKAYLFKKDMMEVL